MNQLTREEQVWLAAYCAAISGGYLPKSYGDSALKDFTDRFPVSTLPQKDSVSEAIELDNALSKFNEKYMADSVLVTREMLAKAWDERVWQPHQQGGIGSTLRSEAFKLFCKDLGLSE